MPPIDTPAEGIFNLTCTVDSCMWSLDVMDVVNMTMAHIHMGGPEDNGPVIVWLVPTEEVAPADANDLPMLSPTFTGSMTWEGTLMADTLGGTAAGMSIADVGLGLSNGTFQAYVNVHTTTYPGGEIRGQIMMA